MTSKLPIKTMSKDIQLLWRCFAVQLLLFSLSTAAPQAANRDALHEMGSLLGLPQGGKAAASEDIPKFVKDIHDCWNSNQTQDCLPDYSGTDVNQLRASLGTYENQSALALHSFNTNRELKNSVQISFNISLNGRDKGTIRYAILRAYREPVEELAVLQNCDLSKLSLQLYTQTSMEGKHPIFSLQSVQSLSKVDFTEGGWVEFLNLTNMYKSLIHNAREELEDGDSASVILNTRLAVSSTPSCSHLTPSALGFVPGAKHGAQLIGFEEHHVEGDISFSNVMSLIARVRRSAGNNVQLSGETSRSGTVAPTENPTQQYAHAPLTNPNAYQQSRCRLYRHHITFSSIGWNTIISPSGYTANFCAGNCLWPPRHPGHINRHAYMQAYANFVDDTLFPSPCCVPSPDGLQKFSMAIRGENQNFIIRTYPDMVATKCSCL